jgi:radical S-adenosyl methionine domain-containing protein 2
VNLNDDLTEFIVKARPRRWKIMQVLPIRGQNNGSVDALLVTREEFTRRIMQNPRDVHGRGTLA